MIISGAKLRTKTFRFERKFLVEDATLEEVKYACTLNNAGFSPIYAPRFINNIYFDTPGYNHYFDNVEGNQERMKVRIRWYGNLYGFIAKPVLEIKVKSGLIGTKYSFPLAPFTLDASFTKNACLALFNESLLPPDVRDELKGLIPTLLNQYHRFYYLSFDKQFRLTVDSKLNFNRISFNTPVSLQRSFKSDAIILEMKYDVENDEAARQVSTFFPFPLTKSSKYIMGFDRLYL